MLTYEPISLRTEFETSELKTHGDMCPEAGENSRWSLSSQPCVPVGGVIAPRCIVRFVLHQIAVWQLEVPLD
uniref:IDP701 n=1 Tax=Arundo donax TaxID=35708 RepID=A0A0A9DKZ8_ARUDO